MPETSSRNWDAFNLEELDRRHKEARKKKLYDKFNKSKKDKRIVQPKKSPAGLFICPQCNVPLNANKLESHLEKVHGFKFKTPSNKGHKIKSASESTKTGVKQVKALTCRSLAKELEQYFAEYILELVQLEGVKVNSILSPIPINVAGKIRLKFRASRTRYINRHTK